MDRLGFEFKLKYGTLEEDYTEEEIDAMMIEFGMNPHQYDAEINLQEKQLEQKRSSTSNKPTNRTNRLRRGM